MVEHDISRGDVAANMSKDVRGALGGSREGDAGRPVVSFQLLLLAKGLHHQGLPHAKADVLLFSVHRAVGASIPLVLGVQLLRLVGLQMRHLCPLAAGVSRPLGLRHHLQGVCALDLDGGERDVDAGADDSRVLEEKLDDLGSCWSLGGSVRETSAEKQSPGANIDLTSDWIQNVFDKGCQGDS